MRARYEDEAASVRRYDAVRFWDRRYHVERLKRVAALLERALEAGDRFLDAGCGTGEYLTIAAHYGASTTVGIDISVGYCTRAASTARTASVALAHAAMLPFPDRAFDVVLCSEVIEHLPAKSAQRAMQELTRVAARSLIVTTPNDHAVIRRVARRLAPSAVARSDADVGHVNLLTADDLLALIPRTWKREGFYVWHIAPPVLGEVLRLPTTLGWVLERTESAAQRFAPGAGNVMAISVQRSG